MNFETHIELRCPDCKKSMEVRREEHDYPEAVWVGVYLKKCLTTDVTVATLETCSTKRG